ncbi:hypothetical protein [Hymenobacter saemangeumensis]
MGSATFTAPTLSAAQEQHHETLKQVYEVLDSRLLDIETAKQNGRISPQTAKSALHHTEGLMKEISAKANLITGCPLGIWID